MTFSLLALWAAKVLFVALVILVLLIIAGSILIVLVHLVAALRKAAKVDTVEVHHVPYGQSRMSDD